MGGISKETVRELARARDEPEWLEALRLQSWDLFEKLPIEQSSMYIHHTDLRSVDLTTLEVLPSSSTTTRPLGELEAPDQDSSHMHLQIDSVNPKAVLGEELSKKGVIFTDMASALKKYPDVVSPHLRNRAIPSQEDKLVALNSTLFNSGVFLYVPSDVEVDIPLRVTQLMSSQGVGSLGLSISVLGSGSKVGFIEEGYSAKNLASGAQSLRSGVMEVYVGEGAELNMADVQSYGGNVIVFSNKRFVLERYGKVNLVSCALGGRFTRSNVSGFLEGSGANMQEVEVVFGSHEQQFDMASTLYHIGDHTSGDVYSTGVFKDRAKGIFKGMIRIGKKGIGTNSFLSEHSMLLNPEAKADAIPALEIETNDVKASHSASVAQIDEEQIFYLMSRGIDASQSRKIIVRGFFEAALRRVQFQELKERIGRIVEEKWEEELSQIAYP